MEKGADAVEYIAVSHVLEGVSGCCFEGKSQGAGLQGHGPARLWDTSLQLAGYAELSGCRSVCSSFSICL